MFLVTEPTPFGLHDLEQADQVTRELGIPAGVIVNRAGIGDSRVKEYCKQHALPILAEIPFRRAVAQGLAKGKTLVEIDSRYKMDLINIYRQVQKIIQPEVGV